MKVIGTTANVLNSSKKTKSEKPSVCNKYSSVWYFEIFAYLVKLVFFFKFGEQKPKCK